MNEEALTMVGERRHTELRYKIGKCTELDIISKDIIWDYKFQDKKMDDFVLCELQLESKMTEKKSNDMG